MRTGWDRNQSVLSPLWVMGRFAFPSTGQPMSNSSGKKKKSTFEGYLQYTRSPLGSFLMVLPLLIAYHAIGLLANFGHRHSVINGADAIVQNFMATIGVGGWLGSWMALALIAGIICFRKDAETRKDPVKPGYFLPLLLESGLYAMLFGSVVAYVTSLVLPFGGLLQIGGGGLSWGQRLAASLGAGLYEELVFRLVLCGGSILLLLKLGLKTGPAAFISVMASSFIFSLFHYIGPYADAWQVTSFTFRLIAGIAFAGLFYARGFAVAAWTHALYDVFLLLLGKG